MKGYDFDVKGILIGHEKGIRCLCVIYNDLFEKFKNTKDLFFEYIVSADCNGSIFVWKNIKHDNKYSSKSGLVYGICEYNDTFLLHKKIEIHEKYVYALCYSKYVGISQIENESSNTDTNLEDCLYVYSGGSDKNIYLFNLNGFIELVLQGHKNSVCSIVEKNEDTLISGDWNGEVFIWKIKKKKKKKNEDNESEKNKEMSNMDYVGSGNCYNYTILKILDNHKHATYVNCLNDFILSISQNNILHIWNNDGQKTEEIKNIHNQSVRDIIIFNQSKNILTFSNDETVNIYDANFNILKIYKGHTGFIFYVFVNEEKQIMVSCSDDKTMKIWNIADIYELMKNYNISLLPTSNIIASSNACLQTIPLTDTIWSVKKLHNHDFVSACNDRFIRVYTNEETKKLNQEILLKFENEYMKKEEKLGDKDVLSISDIHKIKGKEGEVKIFKNGTNYEAHKYENGQWTLIGNVVDDASSSKKFYGGDHIFKQGYYDELFSIDIGNGLIKVLPYNKNDNVLLIAEQFCKRECIHSSNIKSIVNFVNENKPDKNIPMSNLEEEIHSKFNSVLSVFSIPKAAMDKIFEKIKEFNKEMSDKQKLNDTEINILSNIINIYKVDIKNTYKFNTSDINLIAKLCEWPAKYNFPVIDLFRILILNKNCDFLFNNKYSINIFKLIYDCVSLCIKNMNESKDVDQQKQTTALLLCCLRCYVNMFYLPTIRYEMFKKYNFVSKQCVSINSDNANINILFLKIFFNYVIALNATNDNGIRNSLFDNLNSFKDKITDAEALYLYSICHHTSYFTYKAQTTELLKKYDVINFIQSKLSSLSMKKKDQQENSQNEKFIKNISLILESFHI